MVGPKARFLRGGKESQRIWRRVRGNLFSRLEPLQRMFRCPFVCGWGLLKQGRRAAKESTEEMKFINMFLMPTSQWCIWQNPLHFACSPQEQLPGSSEIAECHVHLKTPEDGAKMEVSFFAW